MELTFVFQILNILQLISFTQQQITFGSMIFFFLLWIKLRLLMIRDDMLLYIIVYIWIYVSSQ